MKYISVCSGIEAATTAWHPLGWTPLAFSEIEPFPCKVLAHHYPDVPNLGDMTKFKEWPEYDNVDLLVGGTPCQSFSVAGLRKGLDDPRGNLMLTYLAIADKYKPTWVVWENVPGVLSSSGGRDFGTFLGAMAKLGYGFAYRVLDAQFVRTDGHPYAVPQRRRRVFVVGCLGSWQRAAAVLFDSESLRGNPPPSRKAGKGVAGTIGARTGVSIGAQDATSGHMTPAVAKCLTKGIAQRYDSETETMLPIALVGNTIGRQPHNGGNGTGFDESGTMCTLTKTDVHAVAMCPAPVGPTMGSSGPPYSRTGNERVESEALAVVYGWNGDTTPKTSEGVAPTSSSGQGGEGYGVYVGGVDYENNGHTMDQPTGPLLKGSPSGGGRPLPAIATATQVRRLTPRECERLQAFPDDYTNIPGASDTARYKALGNSMAVNVMQLIGERIQYVEGLGL